VTAVPSFISSISSITLSRRAITALTVVALLFVVPFIFPNHAEAKKRKAPPPPPLDGQTIDYAWDGKDIGHPERAWLGRSFVHRTVSADATKPRPLLVFIHGLNSERIPYRWMGGGNEGDVRRIMSGLMESGKIPPMIVAAPSSTVLAAVTNAVTSWPQFDLDRFVTRTRDALAGVATIDTSRIIVAGHSGGGCNAQGGMASAIGAKNPVYAALAIDTCMLVNFAEVLTNARSDMHVVVSWQSQSWDKRPFDHFRAHFTKFVKKNPPAPGFLRELEHVRTKEPSPHDAMVGITLGRWLPTLIPVSP
jgi:pimeloyl-ACP methyl ester carboxylesterase